MAFVTERPPIFCLACTHVCFRGMLLPQTQSEARKFCILETESCNLVNTSTFRCKFNKGAENKILVLQAQPTQLCIMDEFFGWQEWYTSYYPPSQTRKGIYPTITLYKSAHLALLTNANRTWGCASGSILSVRCKILKYRSNLRLYPVNFGNKLCILIFIILSIWPNFLIQPLLRKHFWSPLSGNSKLFCPPLHFAKPPPTKYLWTLP